jgi:cytochrome c-type biogenesis protein CcmH/NrfG
MRSWLTVSCRLLFLLLALIAALPPSALALTASQVYEQVKDSVVVVKAYDQKGKPVGLGSGVVLPSGDIITNYHVVKAGARYTVGRGKQGTPATVKAGDPDKDLCLLSAPGLTAKPARLGRTARLKVGEPVYAVGAPQGLELSLSEGIVSQLRGVPPPLIQTTVAISGGSSGGGLFNAEAELVGITTFYLKDGQSLNFALPVEWIGEVAGRKIRERPRGEAPITPAPGATWLDRKAALEKAGDWPGLLAHCRLWTQAESYNGLAWYNLGDAYGNLGRHREAIAAYRKALRLKPDETCIWNNLGAQYGKMGRHHDAIAAYKEALRLKPDDVLVWYNLAGNYGNLGSHHEAIAAYKEALRLKPDFAWAWDNLGNVYGKLGRYREEIEAHLEALRFEPDLAMLGPTSPLLMLIQATAAPPWRRSRSCGGMTRRKRKNFSTLS